MEVCFHVDYVLKIHPNPIVPVLSKMDTSSQIIKNKI